MTQLEKDIKSLQGKQVVVVEEHAGQGRVTRDRERTVVTPSREKRRETYASRVRCRANVGCL